ncbi:site-specific integrase [Azospirillum sp. B506]|uniref:tyrosine-type recombinase/integrase n=1 Tax=Azospirillum sp. B506 TaxID=137721 RepID=UPI00131F3624|nr:site-specific integrase [Azospirillum sp. B506]
MASVRKREWQYNGEVKTAWVVNYTDQSGKRRLKTFDRKKEADAYRLKVETEIEKGEHTADGSSATVARVCDQFIKSAEERYKVGSIGTSTFYKYRLAVDRYIIPAIGSRRFNSLSWSDLETLQRGFSKISPATAEGYLTTLKMIEDYAIRRGYTKKRIVRDYRLDFASSKKKKIRIPAVEDILSILKVVDERPRNYVIRGHMLLRCFVHLAAFCGLRYGEIAGLTKDNIDLENRMIMVRHSLTNWDELKEPKTEAGIRNVPIPAHIVALLKEWIEKHQLMNDRDLVFRTSTGCPINSGNFHTHFWHPLLKRAGLYSTDGDQLHFHALRHFTVSFMLNQGIPVTEVSRHVGHSRSDITLNTYAHALADDGQRQEAMDRIADVLLDRARVAPQPTSMERIGERNRKDQARPAE